MYKFVLLSGVIALSACGPMPTDVVGKAPFSVSASDRARYEGLIKGQMKDPNAAQLDSLTFSAVEFRGGQRSQFVCGQVNGKNSFGAYTGWRPFVYQIDTNQMSIEDSNQFVSLYAWPRYC